MANAIDLFDEITYRLWIGSLSIYSQLESVHTCQKIQDLSNEPKYDLIRLIRTLSRGFLIFDLENRN